MKAGKYAPVYFLQGEETFLHRLISNYIEANALSESERSFNQVIMYGKDVTMAAILTNARRFPMMAERQVVIVKEAQDIQDLNKEIGAKLLLDYLTKQVPSTVLVFCHKHKHLINGGSSAEDRQLRHDAHFKKLYDNQLPDLYTNKFMIKDQHRSAGCSVLCEYVG